MKTSSNGTQTCSHERGRRRLNGFLVRSRRRGRIFVGKGVVDKFKAACSVINADIQLANPRASHDVGLDSFLLVNRGVAGTICGSITQGLEQREEFGNLDRRVDLCELREKAGEKSTLKQREIRGVSGILGERDQERRNGTAKSQRVKCNLENRV